MQGIASAQAKGKYTGRKMDYEKRKIIASLLKAGYSYSDIQKTTTCSYQLIANVARNRTNYSFTYILIYLYTHLLIYSFTYKLIYLYTYMSKYSNTELSL